MTEVAAELVCFAMGVYRNSLFAEIVSEKVDL